MNGFFTPDLVGGLGTWVAVLLTVGVWSYAVGERTLFRLLQLLLAGLATGYLALLAIHDVLLPRLLVPLVTDAPNLFLANQNQFLAYSPKLANFTPMPGTGQHYSTVWSVVNFRTPRAATKCCGRPPA